MYKFSLIAVSASFNRSKSDSDPAEWMLTNAAYRCSYLSRWVSVKYRWSLTVDPREKRYIKRSFSRCSKKSIGLPNISKASIRYISNVKPNKPTQPKPDPSKNNDPRFSTYTAASAAGYGPYFKGKDPEYVWYRDGDGDGDETVCE